MREALTAHGGAKPSYDPGIMRRSTSPCLLPALLAVLAIGCGVNDEGDPEPQLLTVNVETLAPPVFAWDGPAVSEIEVLHCLDDGCGEGEIECSGTWVWHVCSGLDGVGRLESPVEFGQLWPDAESWPEDGCGHEGAAETLVAERHYMVRLSLLHPDPRFNESDNVMEILAEGTACFTGVDFNP